MEFSPYILLLIILIEKFFQICRESEYRATSEILRTVIKFMKIQHMYLGESKAKCCLHTPESFERAKAPAPGYRYMHD